LRPHQEYPQGRIVKKFDRLTSRVDRFAKPGPQNCQARWRRHARQMDLHPCTAH